MRAGWLSSGGVAGALLCAAAAAAQQSGTAAIAESKGTQAGCVEWSHSTRANPSSRSPDRVDVVFTYRNRCQRTVTVQLRSQNATVNQGIRRDGDVTLAAGETYAPRRPYRNYIVFDPLRDRFLRFWVFQSDQRFNIANGNLLNLNRCIPGFDPTARLADFPPCPPANTYR